MKAWKRSGIFLLVAVLTLGLSPQVFAQQSESTNYGVDQAYFGSGGEIEMNSDSYSASAGVGDSASGNVEGVAFSGQAGSPTSSEPLLELIVGGGGNHGVLDPSQTYYGTVQAWVRALNSSGYVMQVSGLPPNQTVHTIPGLATPQESQAGTEQFGINLANNTIPNVGAEPEQVPDDTFAFGIAAPDYATPDLFKYVSGDIIAQSGGQDGEEAASGETRYTLSYILNLANLTPAGRYEAKLSVVVSAKF